MEVPLSTPHRKPHRKQRTGCDACKRRRVKCGEERPRCMRCIKRSAVCNYSSADQFVAYSMRPSKQKSPPQSSRERILLPKSIQPSTPKIDSDGGHQYLDVFQVTTSFRILSHTSESETKKLRDILLQASVSEPSIFYALAAFGALEKASEVAAAYPTITKGITKVAKEHHQDALKLYSRAIRRMQDNVAKGEQDIRTTVLSCLVILCFEAWNGNNGSALQQMQTGIHLIQESKASTNGRQERSSQSEAKIEEIIAKVFDRLAIQAAGFKPNQWPAQVCRNVLGKNEEGFLAHMPLVFTSLEEAECYQGILLRYGIHLIHNSECPKQECRQQTEQALSPFQCEIKGNLAVPPEFTSHLSHIELWLGRFESFMNRVPLNQNDMISASILKVQIKTVRLGLLGAVGLDEMVYDDHLDEFKDVLGISEMVLQADSRTTKGPRFGFDLGIVAALQFTAQNCRHRYTRRKALRLLLTNARREGVWDSLVVGKMMTRFVDAEEAYLENGFIPIWARKTGPKLLGSLCKATFEEILRRIPKKPEDETCLR